MPRLSIIIPLPSATEALESTLVSVLENRPRDCEIFVALAQKYDDPYSLAGEVTFLEVGRRATEADCVNAAVAASTAPVVHLLAPGCEVSEGWSEAPLGDLKNPRVASVAPLVYDAMERSRLVAAGVTYSTGGARRLSVSAPADARQAPSILGPAWFAAFYRREALLAVGGYQPSLGDGADVDVAIALGEMGFASQLEPKSITFASSRVIAERRGFMRGVRRERLFWRNATVSGWLKGLACHPGSALLDACGELPRPSAMTELLGRLVGLGQASSHGARHEQLRRLRSAGRPSTLLMSSSASRIDSAHAQVRAAEPTETRARAS